MEVLVIRSKYRRKTIQAQVRDGRLLIRIPDRLSKAREKAVVEEMREKMEQRLKKRDACQEESLLEKAQKLNRKYFDGKLPITSVKFVDNQKSRFGSCTITTGEIRISSRIARAPKFVLDYLLIHEMAHLIYPNHGKGFKRAVDRFPLAERARGYLIALSMIDDD